ncbi:MAG TPA: NifB/NifX family molybdenum-iron cluster-binding protein [Bacteroidales bacterium]|nr:NifB/NifX family molybdenum-iron cluster-binding protein [Bacteroidales bacterium]
MKRIAIPINGQNLSAHFGHCEKFGIFDIENNEVVAEQMLTPPPHEPGVLPRWLASQGVNEILAGGMGQRAIQIFNQNNVEVIIGVKGSGDTYKHILEDYLKESLVSGLNSCDH